MARINFGQIAMKAAGLGAGAVAGKLVVTKVAPNMNPAIKNAALVVLGAVGPGFLGRRNQLFEKIGDGMIAVGVQGLVGGFVPALAGIGEEYLEDFDTSIGEEDEYVYGDDDEDNAIQGDE